MAVATRVDLAARRSAGLLVAGLAGLLVACSSASDGRPSTAAPTDGSRSGPSTEAAGTGAGGVLRPGDDPAGTLGNTDSPGLVRTTLPDSTVITRRY